MCKNLMPAGKVVSPASGIFEFGKGVLAGGTRLTLGGPLLEPPLPLVRKPSRSSGRQLDLTRRAAFSRHLVDAVSAQAGHLNDGREAENSAGTLNGHRAFLCRSLRRMLTAAQGAIRNMSI